MTALTEKRRQLLRLMAEYESCAVAFSGGVDSAVVAKAAQLALGDNAVAVTGVSPSLPEGELEQARTLAQAIGIRHVELSTNELTRVGYVANAGDRCFHCKTELYTELSARRDELGVAVMANGANADDMVDFRPGNQAAREHGVQSPLAACSITKSEVRQLAADWQLSVAEKAASPCLSSRIAYGQEVTPQRLRMVDRAEQTIRELGLRDLRVRYHGGDLARIEVPTEAISELASAELRTYLVTELKRLGFKFVVLDLEGFRSGSLNQVLSVESLTHFS